MSIPRVNSPSNILSIPVIVVAVAVNTAPMSKLKPLKYPLKQHKNPLIVVTIVPPPRAQESRSNVVKNAAPIVVNNPPVFAVWDAPTGAWKKFPINSSNICPINPTMNPLNTSTSVAANLANDPPYNSTTACE